MESGVSARAFVGKSRLVPRGPRGPLVAGQLWGRGGVGGQGNQQFGERGALDLEEQRGTPNSPSVLWPPPVPSLGVGSVAAGQ